MLYAFANVVMRLTMSILSLPRSVQSLSSSPLTMARPLSPMYLNISDIQYAVTGVEEFYISLAYIGYNAYGRASYIRKGGYLTQDMVPIFITAARCSSSGRRGARRMVVEAAFRPFFSVLNS